MLGRLVKFPGVHYTGVDVVPALIERNRSEFRDSDVEFLCRDIIRDALPNGELCLVRQVFQHLSNAEILRIIPKLRRYPFVLVTEHCPAPRCASTANIEKGHGDDTRVTRGSAVYLERPPFSTPVDLVLESVVESPTVARGETLRTVLLRWHSRSA